MIWSYDKRRESGYTVKDSYSGLTDLEKENRSLMAFIPKILFFMVCKFFNCTSYVVGKNLVSPPGWWQPAYLFRSTCFSSVIPNSSLYKMKVVRSGIKFFCLERSMYKGSTLTKSWTNI